MQADLLQDRELGAYIWTQRQWTWGGLLRPQTPPPVTHFPKKATAPHSFQVVSLPNGQTVPSLSLWGPFLPLQWDLYFGVKTPCRSEEEQKGSIWLMVSTYNKKPWWRCLIRGCRPLWGCLCGNKPESTKIWIGARGQVQLTKVTVTRFNFLDPPPKQSTPPPRIPLPTGELTSTMSQVGEHFKP